MPTSTSNNSSIGISLGDPAGIGPEVVAKALKRKSISRLSHFTIFGDAVLFKKHKFKKSKRCSLIDLNNFTSFKQIKKGINKHNGAAALSYLNASIRSLKRKQIKALVTAPICKESIAKVKPSFVGHTELFAQNFKSKDVEMMFVRKKLRVVIVTRHLPIKKVSAVLTKNKVYGAIQTTHQVLKTKFKIQRPHIAVCGLNPHAGESGLLGKEEHLSIIPAIKKAQAAGIRLSGPYAADTIFIQQNRKKFDAIIAMYHDQGLGPIKTLYFDELVNLTIGLPFIRTSPDHGTGFDIVGKNKANPTSMIEAIKLAAKLS